MAMDHHEVVDWSTKLQMPQVKYRLEPANLRPHPNPYYKGFKFAMSRICNDGSAQTFAANDNVMVESFDHVVAPTSSTSYSRKRKKISSESSKERKRSWSFGHSGLVDFSSGGCGYDESGHDGAYADRSDYDGHDCIPYEAYYHGSYYNHGNYGDRESHARVHGGDYGRGYNRYETHSYGGYYGRGNYGDRGSRAYVHGDQVRRSHSRLHAHQRSHQRSRLQYCSQVDLSIRCSDRQFDEFDEREAKC